MISYIKTITMILRLVIWKQKKMFEMQFFVVQNQLVLEKPSKHSRAVKHDDTNFYKTLWTTLS